MFTSAAVEAYSLTYNNGELRLLSLFSKLQLACFLNVDDTGTVVLIFGTRTQCSSDDSWALIGTVGSRGRNNKVAAADGHCRTGSGTLNCSLPHLSWVRQVSCEAYFTNDAAQHGMKGETQCHPMPAWAHAGLDVSHCIQSLNGYWRNCKALRIRIRTNSCIRDHSFMSTSPQRNKRWGEGDETNEKGKNTGAEKHNSCCVLHACTYRLPTVTKTVTWRCLQWRLARNNWGFCI